MTKTLTQKGALNSIDVNFLKRQLSFHLGKRIKLYSGFFSKGNIWQIYFNTVDLFPQQHYSSVCLTRCIEILPRCQRDSTSSQYTSPWTYRTEYLQFTSTICIIPSIPNGAQNVTFSWQFGDSMTVTVVVLSWSIQTIVIALGSSSDIVRLTKKRIIAFR